MISYLAMCPGAESAGMNVMFYTRILKIVTLLSFTRVFQILLCYHTKFGNLESRNVACGRKRRRECHVSLAIYMFGSRSVTTAD